MILPNANMVVATLITRSPPRPKKNPINRTVLIIFINFRLALLPRTVGKYFFHLFVYITGSNIKMNAAAPIRKGKILLNRDVGL